MKSPLLLLLALLAPGMAMAAPDEKGFRRLLDQHAQTITNDSATFGSMLHEDGWLGTVHHVVSQRLRTEDTIRQWRQFGIQTR